MGLNNTLPWHIPEDWRFFLETVRGGVLIEGRECFEGRGGPVDGVHGIVLTRRPGVCFDGAETAGSLSEAVTRGRQLTGYSPIWIAGGAGVYAEALPLADRLYLTQIDGEFEADTYFPEWEHLFTREVSRRASRDGGYDLVFRVLEKEPEAPSRLRGNGASCPG